MTASKFIICTLVCLLILNLSYGAKMENLCDEAERNAKECLSINQPVCGISVAHHRQIKTDFLNKCTACRFKEVEFVVEGHCSLFPENGGFCHPRETTFEYCPDVIVPTCGIYEDQSNCANPPCGYDFDNSCQACQTTSVVYAYYGECKNN